MSGVFGTVVVANRGEIAVRVLRTLRRLGIRGVALYSDADADARHVRDADAAVRLGPAPARGSYLDVDRVVDAAVRAGGDALHPGYGFLAESPALATACAGAGITFVGPSPEAIAAMGDKIRAREAVVAAGVAVVPGRSGAGLTDTELADAAVEVGLPVLLKPSAGGGGKGMRLVTAKEELPAAIAGARREAAAAFGDDTLLVERFVPMPRHIEVQVAADVHGGVVHLGERECSLQRRHQKVVEESPSPLVTPERRVELGERAVAVARACGYTNVGTVELIVSGHRPDEAFFLEMNTRLQVEHPVTELTYGVDLVEVQLRLAAGERLPWRQDELVPHGHAVEARVSAEDPGHGFLPTGGTVRLLREPGGAGVRVDSGLAEGTTVTSDYDPLLAKVIAHGETRDQALGGLRAALRGTAVLGVTTNVAFLHDLLGNDDVRAGRLDTGLVERLAPAPAVVPDEVVVAAWSVGLHRRSGPRPWERATGWRLGGPAWIAGSVEVGERRAAVRVRAGGAAPDGPAGGASWLAAVDGAEPVLVRVVLGDTTVRLDTEELTTTFDWAPGDDGDLWLGAAGRSWLVTPVDPLAPAGRRRAGVGAGPVVSPMPGTVVAVPVRPGEAVAAGQPVAVVEAMKMEHTLTAPVDGVVGAVHVQAGDRVAMRQPVVTVSVPEEGAL